MRRHHGERSVSVRVCDAEVSTGIAAAQKASVESDPRLRVYHLRRAREILMKALKQAGERGSRKHLQRSAGCWSFVLNFRTSFVLNVTT